MELNLEKFSELELHNIRVGFSAYKLAYLLNIKDYNIIKIAGLNHDIGKVYIPKDILNKPGKLTSSEFEIIKKHPLYSFLILKKKKYSEDICNIVKFHHESYNGEGYPFGLKAEEIPLGARIIKICDVFDALTNDRVYRKAISFTDALDIMDKESSNFDPYLYDFFKLNYTRIV